MTGGNSGIGLAIAERLAMDGFCVFSGSRNGCNQFSIKDGILLKNQVLDLCCLDVTNERSIRDFVEYIGKISGVIDCVVNSAGIAHGSLLQTTRSDDIRRCLEVNFIGPIAVIRNSFRFLRKSNFPSIINISSSTASRSDIGTLAYGSSKAALDFSGYVLAAELARYKIRVNTVAPGITQTQMLNDMSERSINENKEACYLNRIAEPEDVANIVRFLASENSAHINGLIIRADGGQLCR